MDGLDNPVWASLSSRHATLGSARDGVARYWPDVAPFAAVESSGADVVDRLEQLVGAGETVLFVGPAPTLPAHWQVSEFAPIAQLVRRLPMSRRDGEDICELGEPQLADMLALTALVYPHYFRRRTPAMGRYIGIYIDGVLAAMAGERMGFDGFQEISAVCTHPEHTGRGHAQRLVAELVNASLATGRLPFLHVSHENVRAKTLYERLGFSHRTDIGLRSALRTG